MIGYPLIPWQRDLPNGGTVAFRSEAEMLDWDARHATEPTPLAETQQGTVALAVESARRWARRTDLSPELRLRRIWTVLEAALR